MKSPLAVSFAVVGFGFALPLRAEANLNFLFVGTYTGGKSEGIYAYRFDAATGEVRELGLAAKAVNPTFLAVHPGGKFVYAANEVGEWNGKPGGYVTAYRVEPTTGKLIELNRQSSVGGGPCHLNVDGSGKNVLVANYGGGSVAVLPIADDGSLKPHSAFVQHVGASVNPARQKEPHAHSVNLSLDNRFAFVADLGMDKIHAYAFEAAAGSLTAKPELDLVLPPGSGPRHFAFGPKGARAYVINELLQTLVSLRYAPKTGKLTVLDSVSTLPDAKPVEGNSTAEVRVHPNGKFVYGSNRGHDSIAVFAVGQGGKLGPVQNVPVGGRTPRNFNFDPSGKFLFAGHQGSDSFAVFSVDAKTGQLTATGKAYQVGAPVCFRFAPAP
jgi:6-phosphogluconolactonase